MAFTVLFVILLHHSWHNGANHLIFNMIAGSAPDFFPVLELNLGNALIAGADFDTYTFRAGFDISIPIYSPLTKSAEITKIHNFRYGFGNPPHVFH